MTRYLAFSDVPQFKIGILHNLITHYTVHVKQAGKCKSKTIELGDCDQLQTFMITRRWILLTFFNFWLFLKQHQRDRVFSYPAKCSVSTRTGLTDTKFFADIHSSQTMNSTDLSSGIIICHWIKERFGSRKKILTAIGWIWWNLVQIFIFRLKLLTLVIIRSKFQFLQCFGLWLNTYC